MASLAIESARLHEYLCLDGTVKVYTQSNADTNAEDAAKEDALAETMKTVNISRDTSTNADDPSGTMSEDSDHMISVT